MLILFFALKNIKTFKSKFLTYREYKFKKDMEKENYTRR